MAAPTKTEPPAAEICSECGGRLSEPISGSVHCYRKCVRCGEEFQMDDPRLAG